MIDKKYLVGFKWRNSEPVETLVGGRKVISYKVVERALTPSDIIALKDNILEYNIVTSDGRKYTIPKLESVLKKEVSNV